MKTSNAFYLYCSSGELYRLKITDGFIKNLNTVKAKTAPEEVTKKSDELTMKWERSGYFIDLVEKEDGNQFYLYATSNYDLPTIILENSQGNSLNISTEFKESGFDSRTSNVGLCYSATRDEVYLCLSTGHLLKVNDDLSYSVVLKSSGFRTTSEANSVYSCELANGLMYIYMYKGFVDITAGTVKRYEMGNDGVIRDQLVDVRSENVVFYDMGGNQTKSVMLKSQVGLDVKTYSTFLKKLYFAEEGMYIFDFNKKVVYFFDGETEMLTPKYTLASNISEPNRIMKANNGFYFYYSRGELYKVD